MAFLFRIEVSLTWSVTILWLIRSLYPAKQFCSGKILVCLSATQVISARRELSFSRGHCIMRSLSGRVDYCILAVCHRYFIERSRRSRRTETGLFPRLGLWHRSIWTIFVRICVSVLTAQSWSCTDMLLAVIISSSGHSKVGRPLEIEFPRPVLNSSDLQLFLCAMRMHETSCAKRWAI